MSAKQHDSFTIKVTSDGSVRAEFKSFDGMVDSKVPSGDKIVKVGTEGDDALKKRISNDILKLRRGSLTGKEDIKQLGQDLYQALFPSEIGSLFESTLRAVLDALRREHHRWLRLMIEIHPGHEAYRWPLEFLYCPNMERWLATERSVIALSRSINFGGTFYRESQTPPLRVLVIISRPKNAGGVTAAPVLEQIGKWAKAASADAENESYGAMEVRVLGDIKEYEIKQSASWGFQCLQQPASWPDLRKYMAADDWRPHVVHFIGHGRQEHDGEGELGLLKETGDVDWCPADLFRNSLPTVEYVSCSCRHARAQQQLLRAF